MANSPMALSDDQLRALGIVERCASVLSILGIAMIIGTFCFSQHFRNPIHRLIFINAFYNLFDVTATMISLNGPGAGNGSALCQFQGFLMQMFPLADVLWTLAMACDVFLVVFYRYDTKALRKLEIKYISAITTLVFIPAVTFLFIHTAEKGPMYGSVTLWCSISPNWVLFRIIFYYGPIWFIILIVMILYCIIGIEILKRRRVFKSIGSDYVTLDTIVSSNIVSFDHLNNAEAMSVEVNVQPQPVHMTKLHDEKEAGLASPSTRSTSASHLRPSNGVTLDYRPPIQSPVSFRQYILMPLMFFVVLLAIWVAPTTNRIASFINSGYVSYPLLLAVGSMGSLRGFWNGVVFVTIGMKERKRQMG